MKTKVLVLKGGDSSEREISLKSAINTVEALQLAGFEVSELDIKGTNDQSLKHACGLADVLFPVLHGEGGEDGVLQQKLEDWGIAFIGSGSSASKTCINKQLTRDAAQKASIVIAAGAVVDIDSFTVSELTKKPYVLKPIVGGSSVDTYVVRNVALAPIDAIKQTFKKYGNLLIEELIEGTEITVGVLGDEALPVIEIIPPKDAEFDFINKYNGETQELCPPISVSEEVQAQAQALALKAHVLFGCRDMSRSDFMLNQRNVIFFLETNTIPGLTKESLLPKAAATAGIPMQLLVGQLVTAALKRA